MRKVILHTFVAITFLFLAPSIALACSCDLPLMNKTEKQLIEIERKRSKAIFVGEVIEIIVPKTASGEPAWVAEVRFKVERKWKGVVAEEVSVFTANVCCVCGYEFEVGESYLVYASGSDRLSTNTCTRTARLSAAEKDLRVLGKGKVLKIGKT